MTHCMYCREDLSMYNLDFTREIVCGRCVQRLLGTKNLPQKRHVSPATARTVGSRRGRKGKKPPTGVE